MAAEWDRPRSSFGRVPTAQPRTLRWSTVCGHLSQLRAITSVFLPKGANQLQSTDANLQMLGTWLFEARSLWLAALPMREVGDE